MVIGFYGKLGDLIGRQVELEMPANVHTVDDLRQWLAQSYPQAAGEFSGPRLKAAIDDQIVPGSSLIADVRHVEFFPPVSGG